MASTPFSPKAFLKSRRPERFSDTTDKQATELDRSILEYHLDSLTTRSQENDFQRFAHQLCEYEICPNLLPQTGPIGGGDSKVDSETYPVAESLALAWHVGLDQDSSHERWAFAFSAKKDWQSKVRSDIAKIADTQRGYTKAFFVTNQAVSDKKRAKFEDELRAKHAIDVRILDRTWILDRVFNGGHEALAITQLGVTALSRRITNKGPLDIEREGDLQNIENRIREAVKNERFSDALIEDALLAANIARGLERPRTEVEGQYARADKLAVRYGTVRQQIETAYQWAWTLFWWFEDYSAFSEQYTIVEQRVTGSRNAYDLESLSNLWHCLHGVIRSNSFDAENAMYSTRTNALISELERLSNEKDRPSTALQSETLLLQVQLAYKLVAKEPIGEILNSLKDVILRSEGLVGYPFEPLVRIFSEIGQWLENTEEYDELFNTIVEVASKRDGEIRAAELLLARGETQYYQGKFIDAIATLGKSLTRLYKHETRSEIVHALYLCGCAYDSIGLPWAAKGALLSAASVATNDLWRYGEISPYQAACYRRIKWVELRLGRLPHVLAWHELDAFVRISLVNRGYDAEKLFADDDRFNIALGRLLLRTNLSDLPALQNLPDVLDNLGLDIVADSLLFALGYEERLEEVAKALNEDVDTFALKWRNLSADTLLPDCPLLYSENRALLQSRILGCLITVDCLLDPPCIDVAESILAGIESFLATSALDRAIAHEPELTIEVEISSSDDSFVTVDVQERGGRPHLNVKCYPFDPHSITPIDQMKVREAIFEVVVTALANSIMFKDFEQNMEALFRDERVSERAVAFSTSIGIQSNVLGQSPKTRLANWIDENATSYPLLRTEAWQPEEIVNANGEAKPVLLSGAKPPEEVSNPEFISHEQMATISLIRERLWNRARWNGTLFLTDPDYEYPPVFGLIFRNREAGREIFEYWQRELGNIDRRERIRVTVIRGIDRTNPYAYRVMIGSNPSDFPDNTKFVFHVYRICQMDATTSDNLDRFLEAHSIIDACLLAPAFANIENRPPDIERDLHILIHHIYVRDAWEIGLNDVERVAIHSDDDPVIPKGITNPPILEILNSRNDN